MIFFLIIIFLLLFSYYYFLIIIFLLLFSYYYFLIMILIIFLTPNPQIISQMHPFLQLWPLIWQPIQQRLDHLADFICIYVVGCVVVHVVLLHFDTISVCSGESRV